ncbi:hypothetical protein [Vibrio phage vB_VpaP_SJSY21]|nr:hypothetical protein [Vibrio phage vB_VpaP_SJSY21]
MINRINSMIAGCDPRLEGIDLAMRSTRVQVQLTPSRVEGAVNKVALIKAVRLASGLGLYESKLLCDNYFNNTDRSCINCYASLSSVARIKEILIGSGVIHNLD